MTEVHRICGLSEDDARKNLHACATVYIWATATVATHRATSESYSASAWPPEIRLLLLYAVCFHAYYEYAFAVAPLTRLTR